MNHANIRRVLVTTLITAWLAPASAMDWRPDGVSVQGSLGPFSTGMIGAGVVWDWEWDLLRRKAEISGQTEVFVNHWRADAVGGGDQSITQFGVLPTLRFQLSQGRSPWAIDFGIGASYMDRRLVRPERSFSTRFNFYDVLGVAYAFGEKRQHEWGLRFVHVSNAGIKKPNPGQDFLQLRYVSRF